MKVSFLRYLIASRICSMRLFVWIWPYLTSTVWQDLPFPINSSQLASPSTDQEALQCCIVPFEALLSLQAHCAIEDTLSSATAAASSSSSSSSSASSSSSSLLASPLHSSTCWSAVWALDALFQPLVLRFRFHFYGDHPTNKLSIQFYSLLT